MLWGLLCLASANDKCLAFCDSFNSTSLANACKQGCLRAQAVPLDLFSNSDHSPSYDNVYNKLVQYCRWLAGERWSTCASSMYIFTQDGCKGDCRCDTFYPLDKEGNRACKTGCDYLNSWMTIDTPWDECTKQ